MKKNEVEIHQSGTPGVTKHSPLPWRACADGNCECRQLWSIPGDVPVFTGRSDRVELVGRAHNKWGDGPDLIYGEIPPAEAQANAKFIVRAVNNFDSLLAVAESVADAPIFHSGELTVDYAARLLAWWMNGSQRSVRVRAAIAKVSGEPDATVVHSPDKVSTSEKEG